ncbi:MAG: hypothetical protein ABUL60_03305 [Myxococcales bacterium]
MSTRVTLAAWLAVACSLPRFAPRAAPGNASGQAPARAPAGAASGRRPCPVTPGEIGRLRDEQLDEISGVVESTKNPDVLFVHNDSGDSPRFFAIDRRGEMLAELELAKVPKLIDAEDIALGPGPGGGSFVYLGDTGNNFASFHLGIPRRKAVLYRVAEPAIASSARQQKLKLKDAFPIVLTFPRGARDVEAFFVDPVGGELFLISKQRDGHSQLLAASAAQLAGGGGQLTYLGELRFGQSSLPGSAMPTSAAISKDGSAILVRTYSSVLLFARHPGESVPSALGRAPRWLPPPHEAQGEAIAFVDGDRAFVTISEGVKPAINCAALERAMPP